nr:MAG TPA: hypothetical protein [Caudoviricetes sp.]
MNELPEFNIYCNIGCLRTRQPYILSIFPCHISCHTFMKNSTVYSKTLQNTVK